MRRDPMSVPSARTSAEPPRTPDAASDAPPPSREHGAPAATAAAAARAVGATARGDKTGWYVPLAVGVDALGAGGPLGLVFADGRVPHPLGAALLASAAWLGVRAAHRRYAWRQLGESRGLLAALRDGLSLAGLLAVVQVTGAQVAADRTDRGEVTGGQLPELGLVALALVATPVLTGACSALIHRHLTARRRAARAVRRALVVGEPGPAEQVVTRLAARTDHAYVVVGAVAVGAGAETGDLPEADRLPADPALAAGDGPAVLEAAARCRAELVLAVPGALLTGERLRRLSWTAQDAGLPLVVASGVRGVALRRVRLETAAGLNLAHIAPPPRSGPQLLAKSALDRAGAVLGLLLLAPLFAVLAVAVRLGSPGPALYRQTRVGRHGVPFTMWKFRSMVREAELLRPGLAPADEQDGPTFKIRRDPRVTGVGRLLRRTSLDELPQLVNVLRGEMSLVGPRPPLPDEVAHYDATGLRRLSVKPGLTGPWQVSGRCELSWDESLALDLWYTDNWSLTTDLDLLLRTIRAVADGRGAY
jgi:exopolysaccharide biosynthesis polyprenyl glycosylphosphotransferase